MKRDSLSENPTNEEIRELVRNAVSLSLAVLAYVAVCTSFVLAFVGDSAVGDMMGLLLACLGGYFTLMLSARHDLWIARELYNAIPGTYEIHTPAPKSLTDFVGSNSPVETDGGEER